MTVKEYLAKMPNTQTFLALEDSEQDKWIFQAGETLADHYRPHRITSRTIAIQTMYEFEGEGEDFAMLKRQGVKQFSTEGLSVQFESGSVSPQVVGIIEGSGRAGIGSII